jgi:hypothetical protein
MVTTRIYFQEEALRIFYYKFTFKTVFTDELSVCIKDREFLDYLSDYQLLK